MSITTLHAPAEAAHESEHWTARYLKAIIFVIAALAAFGVYLAFTIPIAVFPATNFPRIVVGIDNGVMPIDQMQVTVTRPIEQAVNSVPGLDHVRVAHQPRIGRSRSVLHLERRYVSDAAVRQCGGGQHSADAAADGHHHGQPVDFCRIPNHGLQPDILFGAAGQIVGAGDIQSETATEPAAGGIHGNCPGRQEPEFHIQARPEKLVESQITVPQPGGCVLKEQSDRLSRVHRTKSPVGTGSGERAGTQRCRHRQYDREDHRIRNAHSYSRCRHSETGGEAGVHDRDRERPAGGAAEHLPPAKQQHRSGRGRSSQPNRATKEALSRRRSM